MAVVLRIFSGLHLGAEIELAEGVYVVGSDDSCDLILDESSLASRHAALRVSSGADGQIVVAAEALDGHVALGMAGADGTAPAPKNPLMDEEALDIPALTPFALGLVTAAWTRADSPDPASDWKAVEQAMAEARTGNTANNVGTTNANGNAVATDGTADGTPPTAQTDSSDASGNDDDDISIAELLAEQRKKKKKDGSPLKPILALGAVVLTAALCFTWQGGKPERSPEQIVRALLDEAGYTKLSVTRNADSVTVSGSIATDKERGRLLRLAQLLHFPLYLDVVVGSDTANAVKASFNTLGLWPDVTELPPSKRPGLMLRGYIRDGVLEEQALAAARRNVPALAPASPGERPQLEVFRDVRHEEDVQVILGPALADAGLREVEALYLPGTVELRGTLTAASREALEGVAASVRKKLGVPIIFEIVNMASQPKPVANIYQKDAAPTASAAPSRMRAEDRAPAHSAFEVTAVSMGTGKGAMRFVTLASGERVFEGGQMPGGYILEKVDVEALTLSKNSHITLYPLRGKNE